MLNRLRAGLGQSLRRRLSFTMAGLIVAFSLALTLAAPPVRAYAGGSCTAGHLGNVCDTVESTGYDAMYYNQDSLGICFWADFNLTTLGVNGGPSGTYGDNGDFYTCPGQTNTYFFAVGFQGCSDVTVYDRSNGQAPQDSNGSDWTKACSY